MIFQALRAPVAVACGTEHPGRHPQVGCRGMCSDLLDPDGDDRGCSVGCTVGVWDIAPLVLIIVAGRCIGFLQLKKCFFQAGVWYEVRRNFVFF